MRLYFVSIIFLFTISCSSLSNSTTEGCNENKFFRNEFFRSIEAIEKYVNGKGNRLDFEKSLTFLSKYVKISNDRMLNYSNSYTTKNDFLNDKKSWLEWYEKKKCDNIQIK